MGVPRNDFLTGLMKNILNRESEFIFGEHQEVNGVPEGIAEFGANFCGVAVCDRRLKFSRFLNEHFQIIRKMVGSVPGTPILRAQAPHQANNPQE
jgi:hypothetical protein